MRIAEVMSTELVTVRPDQSLKDVVQAMVDHGVSAVPVVDADGRVAGIVTEADVMSREAYGGGRRKPLRMLVEYFSGRDPQWLRKAAGLRADEVMTRQIVTASPHEDVRVAARRMVEHEIKRLVVVDDEGAPVGIVSRHDVLQFFCRDDADVAKDLAVLLGDLLRVPEDLDVRYEVDHGVVGLEGTVRHPSDERVLKHAVLAVPGVVDVDSRIEAREAEPQLAR